MSDKSLLNQIKKQKNILKSQKTIITSVSGEKYLESKTDNGELEILKLDKTSFGFVVDEKPDLQVAEILPYLYLSSQDVVQDNNLLKINNITHVLSIGVDISSTFICPGIKHKKIHLSDLPEANLIGILTDCFNFIDTAKTDGENSKVLVHCNAGYSRSPSIVIAYLMRKFGYSFEYSLKLVKEKRMVKPNEGFVKQLKLYERQLANENL